MSSSYKFGFATASGGSGGGLALTSPLTGLSPSGGVISATDTILSAFSKASSFVRFDTVALAEASVGFVGAIAYVVETQQLYSYCATCLLTRDGDLVLNTATGGATRWQSLKNSHKMGDTGWIDTDSMVLTALNATTVRLTLSAVGVFAIKGVKYELAAGNYDVVLSGAATPKFIGIDETGTLYHQDTLWDFDTQCPVSITYWTGTAIAAAPQTEYHGIRDTVWHAYTHQYVGLQYKSGLTFTGSVQTDNTTNPANSTVQYLWSTDGVVQDEDVVSTPGIGQWLQTLGSGLTDATAAIFNFFYFNGTFVTTQAAMADRTPFIHGGGNTLPYWNNAGTLTEASTNSYVVYHYFATPMTGGWAVFARPHNAQYTTLAAAQLARPAQLTWSNYAELKHIYTAIFRTRTSFTNATHRCKLVSLQDFRNVSGGPVAATSATDHNALSNRNATYSHPIGAVFGTISGAIPFHSTTTNGLEESASLTWDSVNEVLSLSTIRGALAINDVTNNKKVAEFPIDVTANRVAFGDLEAQNNGTKLEIDDATGLIKFSNVNVLSGLYVDTSANALTYKDGSIIAGYDSVNGLAYFGEGALNILTATGNVGINVVEPTCKLDISGATSANILLSTNTSNGSAIHGDNTGGGQGVYGTATNGTGVYGTATTGVGGYFSSTSGHALITGTGNVGIGVLSPFTKLTLPATVTEYSLAFNHTATEADSRRWWIGNDSNTFGSFAILTESTQGRSSPDLTRFFIDKNGDISLPANDTLRTISLGGYGGCVQLLRSDTTSTRYARIGVRDSAGNWIDGVTVKSSGYIQLGDSAPAIKVKKLTGTTAAAEGGYTSVTHGVTSSKIISVSAVVFSDTGVGRTPGTRYPAGVEFGLDFNTTQASITNHDSNSESILSKSFVITIIYEE